PAVPRSRRDPGGRQHFRPDPHGRGPAPRRGLRQARGGQRRGRPRPDREPADGPAAEHDRAPLHARPAQLRDHRDQVSPGPLALTLGDPAGVGPEIVVKAWNALRTTGPAFVVVGDLQALASASSAGTSIPRAVTSADEGAALFADALPVLDFPLRSPVVAGQPSPLAAPAIVQWIETAVGLALS